MPTATKKKPVPAPAPVAEAPKTVKQQVAAALEKYFELENAVHADYLLDGETEIATARENLWSQLEEIEEPKELAIGVDEICKYLKGQRTTSDRCALDTEQVHEILDAIDDVSDVQTWLQENTEGWSMVKTENMVQRDKLEEFLRTEIWPADNLYRENVIL